VTFEEIFEEQATKSQIIVTFLAILEMAKAQVIRIMQHVSSGIIRIFNG
jgi:segregation and condensation protein A